MIKRSYLVAVCDISLAAFILIGIGIGQPGILRVVDNAVDSFMPSIQSNAIIGVSLALGAGFDTMAVFVMSTIITLAMFFRARKRDAIQFMATMALVGILVFFAKLAFQRARPANAVLQLAEFAFPSGHTASAVVFFGLLTYLLLRDADPRWRLPAILSSSGLVLLIGFSRLYLNLHWLTDVIGGLVLGAFILATSLIVREKFWSSAEKD